MVEAAMKPKPAPMMIVQQKHVRLAELISFMESSAESGTLLFKLSSLHDLYVSRLHNLQVDKSVNKTRLKNRIIEHYHGEIQEQTDGKNTLLVFNQGMEKLLKSATVKKKRSIL